MTGRGEGGLIDDAAAGRPFDMGLMNELEKLASRGYTEGFYNRHPSGEYQNYERGISRGDYQQFVGEVLDAVVIDDKGDGKMRVLTDNYIEATIDGDVGLRGKRFPIRLLELSDDVVTALRVSS